MWLLQGGVWSVLLASLSSCFSRTFSSTRVAASEINSLHTFTEEEEMLRDSGVSIGLVLVENTNSKSSQAFRDRRDWSKGPGDGRE